MTKEFIINGGTLITAGSAQMNQAPSDSSPQSSIVMTFSNTQEANSTFTSTDSAGNIIAAFAPQKPYQAVVISTPDLQSGQSYTINTGASVSGNATAGYYGKNADSAGTALVTFTAENTVTHVNESGVTAGGMGGFGGRGGPGGNMPNGERRLRTAVKGKTGRQNSVRKTTDKRMIQRKYNNIKLQKTRKPSGFLVFFLI